MSARSSRASSGSSAEASSANVRRRSEGSSEAAWKRSCSRCQRSGVTAFASSARRRGETAAQPGLGERPVPLDGGRGDVQDLGRILHAQSTEGAQLDDPSLLRVEHRKLRERVVESEELQAGSETGDETLVERDVGLRSPALPGVPVAGVVDEDSAHHPSRNAEEVRAVLPDDPLLVDEAQVGLVYEGRGLERVARPLRAKVGRRSPLEVGVEELHQLLDDATVALPPGEEKVRHLAPGPRRHRAISCIERRLAVCQKTRRREERRRTAPAIESRHRGCSFIQSIASTSLRSSSPVLSEKRWLPASTNQSCLGAEACCITRFTSSAGTNSSRVEWIATTGSGARRLITSAVLKLGSLGWPLVT